MCERERERERERESEKETLNSKGENNEMDQKIRVEGSKFL